LIDPPLFIEEPVPRHELERSCVYVLWISIMRLFTIFLLDLGSECFDSILVFVLRFIGSSILVLLF